METNITAMASILMRSYNHEPKIQKTPNGFNDHLLECLFTNSNLPHLEAVSHKCPATKQLGCPQCLLSKTTHVNPKAENVSL